MKEVNGNFKMVLVNNRYYNPNKIVSVGDLKEVGTAWWYNVVVDGSKYEVIVQSTTKKIAQDSMFKLIHNIENSLSSNKIKESQSYSPTVFSH